MNKVISAVEDAVKGAPKAALAIAAAIVFAKIVAYAVDKVSPGKGELVKQPFRI